MPRCVKKILSLPTENAGARWRNDSTARADITDAAIWSRRNAELMSVPVIKPIGTTTVVSGVLAWLLEVRILSSWHPGFCWAA
jgi:hypothetical protein